MKKKVKKYQERTQTMVQQNRRVDCYGPDLIKRFVPRMRDRNYVDREEKIEFTDLTAFVDYHDSMNKVAYLQSEFMNINPRIRARFNNDAGKFYNFVAEPKNRSECIKMGLIKPTEEEKKEINKQKVFQLKKTANEIGLDLVDPKEKIEKNEEGDE